MSNFLSIGLALALVLFGETLMLYVHRGITTQMSRTFAMTTNSISFQSPDKNIVEVDGVSFGTLVSNSVLPIPELGKETTVKFGVHITNKTEKKVRFPRFGIIYPNLLKQNGQVIPLDGGTNGETMPKASEYPLVMPGESVTFFLEGTLSWQNDKLELGGTDGFGGFWYFRDLKPGKYKFQFIYQNYDAVMRIYIPTEQVLEGIWTGKVATPLVEFNLVKT